MSHWNPEYGDWKDVRTSDFMFSVARGIVPEHSIIDKFGRADDVGTANPPMDLWHVNSLYTGFPTQAETLQVFSGSLDDNGVTPGTGAWTVAVIGLDSDWLEQAEVITLNGTTPVLSVGVYRRVFRMYVITAGAGGENAGLITARHSTTTANVMAGITAGVNQSNIACYTIPADKEAYVFHININMSRSGGLAGSAVVSLRTRAPGEVFRTRKSYTITSSHGEDHDESGVIFLGPKSDITWRIESVSDNGTTLTGGFALMQQIFHD